MRGPNLLKLGKRIFLFLLSLFLFSFITIRYDELQAEHRTVVASFEGKLAEMNSTLKLKVFEMERLALTYLFYFLGILYRSLCLFFIFCLFYDSSVRFYFATYS